MDPATLGMLSLGLTAGSAAASLFGGKPKAPPQPTPSTPATPDTTQGQPKTSFLSNAAAAATPSQTSGKSLLGQ